MITSRSVSRFVLVGRRWPLVVLAVVVLAAAALVAWWPEHDATVRVENADDRGICVRDLSTDARQCLAYTPEFPSEARYQVGECLRFRWVYRSDVPPHARRVSCPAPAA